MTLAIPGSPNNHTLYDLYEIFKQTKESKVIMNKYASIIFNNDSLRFVEIFRANLTNRGNFGGAILKGASAINNFKYFTRMDDLSTKHSDTWTKMTYEQVKLLAEDLNFRVVVRYLDNYGSEIKDGKLEGLMLYLQEQRAEVAACGLVLREERYAFLDFMDAPYRFPVALLFRQPPLSSVSNIFVLPFSLTVWISIAAMILIIVLTLWFHMRFSKNVESSNKIITYSDVISYVIGTVCQQGYHINPTSYSARMIVIFLLLTSLALFTSFSATIVALIQSPSTSIRTVKDMTASKMEVGLQSTLRIFAVYLKEENHGAVHEFYVRKLAPKGEQAYFTTEEGIDRLRKRMFAYQVDLAAAYQIISDTYEEREKCGLKELELFSKPHTGMPLPKNSPYKELFARRLRWLWEVGLTTRTWKRWIPPKPKCESNRSGFVSVGLTELNPALLIVFYGISAACILFVLEFFWSYRRRCLHLSDWKKL